jgi:hypothetical protein
MADDKLVTVATFSYAAEAHLSKAKLESAGIWSFVAENFAPIGELPSAPAVSNCR